MTQARSTDHLARARRKLFSQFRQPKIQALLDSWIAPKQDRESAAWEVADHRFNLDAAFGQGLDDIGALLGCGRGERTDEPYRTRLRAWARALRSQGRPKDYTETMALGCPGTTWRVEDYPPASLIVRCTNEETAPVLVLELADVLNLGRAQGMRVDLAFSTEGDASTSFLWSGDGVDGGASWSGDGTDGGGLDCVLKVG